MIDIDECLLKHEMFLHHKRIMLSLLNTNVFRDYL